MAKLGFIGLGAMGSRVTKRLLDAGHTVTGYNRTKAKAQWLLDAGMLWGESPRAVAEAADVVFTMVTNTEALHEVFEGPDGILAGLDKNKILYRHEHCQPRGFAPPFNESSRQRCKHARLAGVRQRYYPRAGQSIPDGGRRRGHF